MLCLEIMASRRKQACPKAFSKTEISSEPSPATVTDDPKSQEAFSLAEESTEHSDLSMLENRSSSRGSGSSTPIGIEEDTEDGMKLSIYKCGFCTERFLQPGLLKQHEQLHSDMMPYKCRHCSKGFKHKRSQDRHEQLHTGYKKHKCTSCDAAFFRSDHLKLHLKTHEITPKSNQMNSQSVSTLSDFGRNGTPTNCSLCDRRFSSADQLLNHMDSDHGIMGNSMGQVSARTTPSESAQRSVGINGGVMCPHCSRQDFISEEALDLHVEAVHGLTNGVHSEDQGLVCGLCQHTFGTVEQLQKHTLHRHTVQDLPQNGHRRTAEVFPGRDGDPRYGCQYCEKSFDGILSLHQHISSVHPNAEDDEEEESVDSARQNNPTSAYVCGQCNSSLADLTSFTAHMRQHIAAGAQEGIMVRPIRPTCELCGIECKDGPSLDAHLVDHYLYKESQYSCSTCSKIFGQPDELQKHLLDVHTMHVFKCSLCKELFESRVDIQVHFAVVHSKEMIQWRCRSCNSAFNSDDQFRVHVEVVHLQRPLSAAAKNSNRDSFTCNICNMECGSDAELKVHTLKHSAFTCPMCCQAFSVEYLFERHMETAHAGYYYSSPLKATMVQPIHTNVGSKKISPKPSNSEHGLFFPLLLGNTASLKCNICDQKTDTLDELAEHKLHHCKVTKSENCYVCYKKLNTVEEFCEHTKQHNTVQGLPVSCIVCRQTLLSPVELEAHAKFHLTLGKTETKKSIDQKEPEIVKKEEEFVEGESVGKCEECSVKFESNEELKNHEAKSHPKPFQCIKCQKSFSTEAEIQSHVTSHVLQDGVEHFCLLCQKVFDSPAKLQAHLIEHSFAGCTEFQCYLCGLIFSLPQPLSQHMLSHGPEERPYDCPYCDQRFFFRAELDNHVLSHQKPSIPPPPLKRATENPDSMKLIKGDMPSSKRKAVSPLTQGRNMDQSSNGSAFPCPHCPKVFGSLSALQGHSHVHMANRIHQCHRCDKSFPTATKLRNHQRQHSGDKPYCCDICSRYFSRKDNLKVHLRTHYKEGHPGSGDELPTMVSLSNTSSTNENDWSNGSDN